MIRISVPRTSDVLQLAAVITMAGSLVGCPSGGVGDPCTPEDEYLEDFSGFKLSEANIESRSYQCKSRICLVNHFQGRVSCPLGQLEPTVCTDETNCDPGESCTQAGILAPECDPTPCSEDGANQNNCNNTNNTNPACGGNEDNPLVCNPDGGFCQCNSGDDCPGDYECTNIPQPNNPSEMTNYTVCATKVCSKSQLDFDATDKLRCYVPGTNTPIATSVCGQCDPSTFRDSESAVYCSCRCAPAVEPCSSDSDCDTNSGEICEETGDLPSTSPEYTEKNCINPNYNYCDCEDNYSCVEVRPYVGLGDKQLSGFYCVKNGTVYDDSVKSCTSMYTQEIEGSSCTTHADCSAYNADQYCIPNRNVCGIRGVSCN